ncbi:hypothetical protein QYF36_007405 [Acer negundo]|nr:hypothetical protein QYF36_007405 [Acer negundo]
MKHEGEEDPYRNVSVREQDLLQDSIAERTTFAHCLDGGGWGEGEGGRWVVGLSLLMNGDGGAEVAGTGRSSKNCNGVRVSDWF